jgi:endonuclease/exonuclease/phosphatase family metal-dependent hydrolase
MFRGVAGMVLVILSFTPAHADFCMLTQNALRLGHGREDVQDAKREGLRRIFRDYDVVVLQEVMEPDEPARVAPAGFEVSVSAAKGRGSYREHYAVLTRRGSLRVLAAAEYPDAAGAFARPPFGVAVEERDGSRTWLVDFHAVFGKGGAAPRRQEVAAMADVLAHYTAHPLPDGSTVERVVVAGDWNLAADDVAFDDLRAVDPTLVAAPNISSSLNAEGRFVSPYDHFLWSRDHVAVHHAAEPRDTGGFAPEDFRATLSDHAGIAGYVSHPGKPVPRDLACPPARVGS